MDSLELFVEEFRAEVIQQSLVTKYISDQYLNKFIDDHVYFIRSDNSNDFIAINVSEEEAVSYKLSNIIIDLRDMLEIIIELALTMNIPDKLPELLKIVLFVIYKIFKLSSLDILKEDVKILEHLHRLNAYSIEIMEDDVVNYFTSKQGNEYISKETVYLSINHLARCKCIGIFDGKIHLYEKIFYK
jgi:hypothetical protein